MTSTVVVTFGLDASRKKLSFWFLHGLARSGDPRNSRLDIAQAKPWHETSILDQPQKKSAPPPLARRALPPPLLRAEWDYGGDNPDLRGWYNFQTRKCIVRITQSRRSPASVMTIATLRRTMREDHPAFSAQRWHLHGEDANGHVALASIAKG